jgi:hypothetical protein
MLVSLKSGGSGNVQKVNRNHQAHVLSSSYANDLVANLRDEKVWSIYFTATATGANDYFFYLKNNGDKTLRITDIRVSSTVATRLEYDIVTGTPTYSSETAITPTNRNTGSASEVLATINYDADITNLTKQGTVFFEDIKRTGKIYHVRTSSNIVLKRGGAIAFKRVASSGAVTCLVSVAEDVEDVFGGDE